MVTEKGRKINRFGNPVWRVFLSVLIAQSHITFADEPVSTQIGYFVISNVVVGRNREAHLLLNRQFYNERSLRVILQEFSTKYPEPERLDVYLYSDIEQTRVFADGLPHHGRSLYLNKLDPGFWSRYAFALVFRHEGNEIIRYYIPGPDAQLETIVVRGRDPALSRNP